MTEQSEPLDTETAEKVALDTGIEAVRAIHAIERAMLNRAIYALVDITGKTPEEVLDVLSDGIDGDYNAAVKQAQASAQIVAASEKPELIIPAKRKPTWNK
jgi:hypothetical protein